MLRKAGKVVKDKELTETLAEILTTRGIGLINEAQKKLQESRKGLTRLIESQVDKGVKCLKEAKDLGSKRGAENYERAKGLVEQAKSGLFGLDPEIAGLINQAQKAAEGSRWDEAIRLMKKARDKAPEAGREALDKMLAQFYNARGVQMLNTATEKLNDMAQSRQKMIGTLVDLFLEGKSVPGFGTKPKKKKWKAVMVVAGIVLLVIVMLAGGEEGQKALGQLILLALIMIGVPIVQALKSTLNPFSSNPGSGLPRCRLCRESASYRFDLPGKGEVSLCSTHSDELRKIIEFEPRPDDLTARLIVASFKDFGQASTLDPQAEVFDKNRRSASEIIDRFHLWQNNDNAAKYWT
ncbi:MAG: hypothetical protein FJY82_07155 [Candidatus Aminicenantes bacterium]|nr:hypothetical protein [Candidatus Aminicenantes bacterium]